RGEGAGGEREGDAAGGAALDQGNDGGGLADAGRVNPEQGAGGAGLAGAAVAFAPAAVLFLALAGAPGDIAADHRIGGGAGQAVGGQHGAGPAFAHDASPSARP